MSKSKNSGHRTTRIAEDDTSPIAGLLTAYFRNIKGLHRLTKEAEIRLARRAKGDASELTELIEANLAFVIKIAAEYRNLGLPFEDVLNDGNLGLIEAAHRFDASRGTKFITYAIWWIRKSILKALTEHSNLVRVPNYQLKKIREIRDAENSLRRSLGRKPKLEEISKRLSKSVTTVDQVLQLKLREVSLEDKVGKERDSSISDYLVDINSTSPEDDLIKREANSLVTEALSHLADQEQTVVTYRFGLAGGLPPMTLQDIGRKMGLSRERVRQIEFRAIARMRVYLSNLLSQSARHV